MCNEKWWIASHEKQQRLLGSIEPTNIALASVICTQSNAILISLYCKEHINFKSANKHKDILNYGGEMTDIQCSNCTLQADIIIDFCGHFWKPLMV